MKKTLQKISAFLLMLPFCIGAAVPCIAATQATINTTVSLTAEEQAYIQENPRVSIAIDTSWTPYEFTQPDGTVGGIIPNLMSLVASRVGLEVDFVGVDTYAHAIQTCREDKTMLVSGIANDPKMAEKNDVLITDPYLDIGYSAVTNKEIPNLFADGGNYTAAICVGTYAKMVMQEKMPSFEFKEYKSNQECMDAVIKGEADIALVANYSVGYFSDFHEYRQLLTIELNDFNWGLCFGVNKETDPMLIQILNKGIASLTQGDMNQAIYAGASEASGLSYSIMEVVYDRPEVIAAVAATGSALLVLILFLLIMRRKDAKALAKEIALRKQAEEANASKTAFLSRVSHDMRTPMNGILGIAALSKEETNVDALHRDIRKMEESGKYLLGLINDTLDLQKIQSGKLTLNPNIVDSASIVRDIESMVTETAKKKGIHFAVKIMTKETDAYVRADELRLKQVFVNLLSNAVKFTPEGGTVEWLIDVVSREGGITHDVFTVRDTGIGMSEHFLKHDIFKPFSQEYNTTTSQYTGSGLGLSIVKSLVEIMDGRIEVESEKGDGTTFRVYLDFEIVDRETAQAALKKSTGEKEVSASPLKGKRILLAEDHPLNAEIARKLLEKKGCVVTWTENGEKVVNAFEQSGTGAYDAILMDIRMPVMDGLEAARQIRALTKADAKTIPIIAMTANAYEEDRKKSQDAGMNAHLAKPIDPKTLYETLAGYLQGV